MRCRMIWTGRTSWRPGWPRCAARRTLCGGELLVEHRFSLAALHELYWGTADAVIVAPPAPCGSVT